MHNTSKNIVYILINLSLILVVSFLYANSMEAASMFRTDKVNFYIVLIGFLLFVFGLLIEHEKLITIFKSEFKLNRITFILSLLLMIISCLPYGSIVPINITIGELLNYKVVRYMFSIWSGILMVRSFVILDTK